jgi:adenylate cyclase
MFVRAVRIGWIVHELCVQTGFSGSRFAAFRPAGVRLPGPRRMDGSGPTLTEGPRQAADHRVFRKDGEYWTIVYEGQAIRLRDAKGLHCLAKLLRNPGRELHATDLIGVGGAAAGDPVAGETAAVGDLGDAGKALDARAKTEYRRRLEDLRDELSEAERFNDAGRIEQARGEMEAISGQLSAGVGLGGRDRPAASHAERARVAVTQRLKAGLAKIRESHPSLGRHLAATVKTGYFCSYNPDPLVAWDDSAVPADAYEAAAAQPLPRPNGTSGRKLAAIFSADVNAYSRLMADDEAATIQTLTAYRHIMTDLVATHRGRVVDSPGDNLLAEFSSAVEAVRAAVAIQTALRGENEKLPANRWMEFRIGINAGDVVIEGERIYGDAINVAARLESLAEPGGICVSGTVYDQVRNKLDIEYESLGERAMKNIAEPVHVYRVGSGRRIVEGRGKPATQAPHWRRLARVVTLSVLLVVAAVAVFRAPSLRSVFQAGAKPVARVGKPSIAVLPFVNLSSDPEQQYFSDGMTEDLIGGLSKISGIFVIAHNSVLGYRARPAKLAEVSRELGVRYVVNGSVRKAGDRIRISAQLLDASTGRSLWSDRYDRELKDIFSVQDEIIRQVAVDLRVEVGKAEFDRVRRIPTENLNAYDSFLRGIDTLRRGAPGDMRMRAIEAHREARRMFEHAIELDSKFASAYAILGLVVLYDSLFQGLKVPLERIAELAEKALSADDSDAIAHVLSAWVWVFRSQGSGEGDRERAIAEAKLAIALDPNNADIRMYVADILSNVLAMPKEGLVEVEQAMRLNPRYPSWYLTVLGTAYTGIGRYQEAIDAHRKALLQNPDIASSRRELVSLYRALGREDEARNEERELRRLNPQMLPDILATEGGEPVRGQAVPAKVPTAAYASGSEQLRNLLRESGKIDQ